MGSVTGIQDTCKVIDVPTHCGIMGNYVSEVDCNAILTSSLHGTKWSVSRSDCLYTNRKGSLVRTTL